MDQPNKIRPLNEEVLAAINAFIETLVSPHVRTLPNSTGPITLDTDASDKKVECLFLKNHKKEASRLFAYSSRTFNNSENSYGTTQRECLAMVLFVLILPTYVGRTQFKFRTYNDSHKWTLNVTDSTGRLARYHLRLSEYDFEVVHRAGKKQKGADSLFRLRTNCGKLKI